MVIGDNGSETKGRQGGRERGRDGGDERERCYFYVPLMIHPMHSIGAGGWSPVWVW